MGREWEHKMPRITPPSPICQGLSTSLYPLPHGTSYILHFYLVWNNYHHKYIHMSSNTRHAQSHQAPHPPVFSIVLFVHPPPWKGWPYVLCEWHYSLANLCHRWLAKNSVCYPKFMNSSQSLNPEHDRNKVLMKFIFSSKKRIFSKVFASWCQAGSVGQGVRNITDKIQYFSCLGNFMPLLCGMIQKWVMYLNHVRVASPTR